MNGVPPDDTPATDVPPPAEARPLTPAIEDHLVRKGQLGLISVRVIERNPGEKPAGWSGYESLIEEIGRFLSAYLRRRLRASDRLLGPSVDGNGYLVLLDPPRDGRELDPTDLARVRLPLRDELRAHLTRHADVEAASSFGCFVGGSILRHRPEVSVERLVHRALEAAFADALADEDRDRGRQLVQLHRLLDAGQVRSVYQPIVDIAKRRVLGYEALSRVPRFRFPSPEQLFKVASANQGLWRLERLCRERALDGLPPIADDQFLFLNVEPGSLHDPQLLDDAFLGRLEAAGLTTSQVVFEMTEHTAIDDYDGIRPSLNRLRDRGFRLAMDDVGAGYSGLRTISEIAPDFLKVDMTLVRDVHRHTIKRELITTIGRFADSTGVTAIAEGVESPDELDSLTEAGVRCAQGFLFARPSAPPQAPDWTAFEMPSN